MVGVVEKRQEAGFWKYRGGNAASPGYREFLESEGVAYRDSRDVCDSGDEDSDVRHVSFCAAVALDGDVVCSRC